MIWPFKKSSNKNINEQSVDVKSSDSSSMGNFSPFTSYFPSSSEWTMVGIPTVLQCVTVLANGISQVPFKIYHKDGRKREVAKDHPLHRLLAYKPNNYQSEYEFMDNIGLRLALQGEVVIWIVRVAGKVRQLIPFSIDRVFIYDKYDRTGFPVQEYHLTKPDGTQVVVPSSDIWHIRTRTFSMFNNTPYGALVSRTLDLAVQEMQHLTSSYSNGLRPSGIVTAKSALSEAQVNIVKEAWDKSYGGATNAYKTIFLGADLEYKPMSASNKDSQQVENRKLMISEICRLFNVNPFMVFEYTNNASYSSHEQLMLQHLIHTLEPLYRLIESGFERYVMDEDDVLRHGYYVRFKEDALLRLDQKTKAEVTQMEINNGVRTINEARELRELTPIEGGDQAIVQGAMIPLKDVGMAYTQNNTNNSQEGEEIVEPSSTENTEGTEDATQQ